MPVHTPYIDPGITIPSDFWTNIATQFILNNKTYSNQNDLAGKSVSIADMLSVKTLIIDSANIGAVEFHNCPAVVDLEIYTNPLLTVGPDLTTLSSLTTLLISGNGITTSPPIVAGMSNLVELDISEIHLTTPPVLTGLTSLTSLTMQGCALMTSAPDVSPCTALLSLNLSFNTIITVAPNVAALTSLVGVDMSYCALTVASINSVLTQLDANGVSAGTVDLSNQTPPSPPSGAGATAVTSLQGKGWTVTTD